MKRDRSYKGGGLFAGARTIEPIAIRARPHPYEKGGVAKGTGGKGEQGRARVLWKLEGRLDLSAQSSTRLLVDD